MSLRRSRLLQLLGLLIALGGLLGYWLNYDPVERTPLTEEVREVLGLSEDVADDEVITFVIAGRDIAFTQLAGPVVRDAQGRVKGRQYEARSNAYGSNTDTIIFAKIVGDRVTLVNIPRDLWLPDWQTKINAMYYYQQAEGVQRGVSEVLGVPVDYYAIINIDIFEHIVDTLGGVEVNVPFDMNYVDHAGQLFIDLDAGVQVLNGEEAAGFVRYRGNSGDYGRIDRIKTLAYGILARLKDLNVRAAPKLPELAQTVFEDTETNASFGLVTSLLGRIDTIQIADSVTIPAEDFRAELPTGESVAALRYNPVEVEQVLAQAFGGTAREFAEAPEARLLITNSSGVSGLEEAVAGRLAAMGVPEEVLLTRTGELDAVQTRVYTTIDRFGEAEFYANLLGVSRQQADRLDMFEDQAVDLELILGRDVAETYLGAALSAPQASVLPVLAGER